MESTQQPRGSTTDGSLNRDISQAMVALYKEYMGRGPTKVRTTVTKDTILCLAQDSLTKAERKLAERDQARFVREIRGRFQDVMKDDAVAMIERLSERKVVSFLSDHDPIADIAIEAFVLAAPAAGGASESAAEAQAEQG